MTHRGSLLALLLMTAAIGCAPDAPPASPDHEAPALSEESARVLCDLGETVIAPTMVDIDRRAEELLTSLRQLAADPTRSRLDSARDAWRAVRKPWSNCEAFPFGLTPFPKIDGEIDGWPVETGMLLAIVDGDEPITADLVARQGGGTKGFHAIEYLLYGENGNKHIYDFSERQLAYLVATAEALKTSTLRLRNAWNTTDLRDSSGGAWALCNAGRPGSIYRTQDAALRDIMARLILLGSDLENRLSLEANNQGEDRFSGNGKSDNLSAVEGMRAIYTGEYRLRPAPAVGRGLSELVEAKDPAADSTMRAQLDEAALTVFVAPEVGYEPAREAVREMRRTLQTRILQIVTTVGSK